MSTPTFNVLPSQLGCNGDVPECAPSVKELEAAARGALSSLVDFATERGEAERPPTFKVFESELVGRVRTAARLLIVLFLAVTEERLLRTLGGDGEFQQRPAHARNLMTVFGVIRYWRTYMRARAHGHRVGRRQGLHPLDVLLGLGPDRISMNVLALGAFLATKLSFAQARECLERTMGQAPATEVLERAVLGLGTHTEAYFAQAPAPQGDGDVLVVQWDGKGVPTATKEELRKRRGKRRKNAHPGSARHRGRKRRAQCRKKKHHAAKPQSKSKNAKMATVLVMYTLRRAKDGTLEGPLNKRVWGSFRSKRHMFEVARREAKKRGFDPDSDERLIQLVTDGDDDLDRYAFEHFPRATQTIDIMHVLEYIWDAGRCLEEESRSLTRWVGRQKKKLLAGRVDLVIKELERGLKRLPPRAHGRAQRRETIETAINYILKRSDKLDYAWVIEQDLELASGAVEGAVKHIVGLRFDHGGMRWIRERAEALLQLRCLVFNGQWDDFIDYVHRIKHAAAQAGTVTPLLRSTPEPLDKVA